MLGPDGTVMLVEPFVSDRVEDNLSTLARFYYAASTTLCYAHAISEDSHRVLGVQAGEVRLAEIFRKASFTRVRRNAFQSDRPSAALKIAASTFKGAGNACKTY